MFIAPKQLEQTLIAKLTKMKRLFRGTFLQSHGNVNKPPIHEAYIVTFVENLIPFRWISVKISCITKLTYVLIFKT